MSRFHLVMIWLACGCVQSRLVPCGTEQCPVGNVCTPAGCARPEAAEVCVGRSDNEPCTTPMINSGMCVGERCQSIECGNAIVELGEICDDGNRIAGDGCSSNCDSVETCGNGKVDPATAEECDTGIAGLSGDGCSSRCFVEPELWRDVIPGTISPRARTAAAYDANEMMVFGGLDDTGFLGDTWTFDDGWTRRDTVAAPSPRHSAAVAYDSARERVVVFGGFGPSGVLGDTWEWDGVAWHARAATGPAPRGAASAAFDVKRARFVMFGGHGNAGDLGDTWEWDGTSWQAITTATSPAPRSEHTMAYADDSTGLVFLYGGGASETWVYDGVDWITLAAPAVVEPNGARLVWNEELSEIQLIGLESTSQQFLSGFYWNGATWELVSQGVGASARTDFAVFSDTSCGCVTVMLGADADATTLYDDVWEYDSSSGTQWDLLDPAASISPPPSIDHAIAFDSKRGQGLLVGGDGPGPGYGSTWSWSHGGWTRGVGFTGRKGHAMAYDVARDRVIVYGGFGAVAGVLVLDSDTYGWDGVAWQRLAPAMSPPARAEHAMAYDVARARIVLFGGADTAPRADTWEWDGLTWEPRTPTTSPSARERHAMAYDASRGRVVLFGGRDAAGQPLADTWEYDGTTWFDVTPTTMSPSPRFDHVLAYDPLRARVLLVGGDLFGTDTWEWNGVAWEARVPSNPPLDRLSAVMFYDTVGHQMVLFGGVGARYLSTTTVRTFELAGQTEDCSVTTQDSDGDGLVGCSDPDCSAVCP